MKKAAFIFLSFYVGLLFGAESIGVKPKIVRITLEEKQKKPDFCVAEFLIVSVASNEMERLEAIIETEGATFEDVEKIATDVICKPKFNVSENYPATITIAQNLTNLVFAGPKNIANHDIGIVIDFIAKSTPAENFLGINLSFELSEMLQMRRLHNAEYPLIYSERIKFSAPIEERKLLLLPMKEYEAGKLAIVLRVLRVSPEKV